MRGGQGKREGNLGGGGYGAGEGEGRNGEGKRGKSCCEKEWGRQGRERERPIPKSNLHTGSTKIHSLIHFISFLIHLYNNLKQQSTCIYLNLWKCLYKNRKYFYGFVLLFWRTLNLMNLVIWCIVLEQLIDMSAKSVSRLFHYVQRIRISDFCKYINK